jgi:hypothetical protein
VKHAKKCRDIAEACRQKAAFSVTPDPWRRLSKKWEHLAEQAEFLAVWEATKKHHAPTQSSRASDIEDFLDADSAPD